MHVAVFHRFADTEAAETEVAHEAFSDVYGEHLDLAVGDGLPGSAGNFQYFLHPLSTDADEAQMKQMLEEADIDADNSKCILLFDI